MRATFLWLVWVFYVPSSYGQCQWSSKSALPQEGSDQPALTVFGSNSESQLVLAYIAKDNDWTVVIASSRDGIQFERTPSSPTLTSSRGVALGASTGEGCKAIYLAFSKTNPEMELTLIGSSDGVHWSVPVGLDTSPTSAPVLVAPRGRGVKERGALAYAVIDETLSQKPIVAIRSFDCELLSIGKEKYCFWGSDGCATLQSVGTPAWAKARQKELRALAQPDHGPIVHDDTEAAQLSESNWSDTGVSAAIDPTSGHRYLAWSGGEDHRIHLFSVDTRQDIVCEDYTYSMPAIAVFKGKVFVAWRGGPDDLMYVASMAPF
jgi:hypothetical protein